MGQAVLNEAPPSKLLTEFVPGLPSAPRLNRTNADAAAILALAEKQMVYMAIPYAISIHHRFLGDTLEFLGRSRPTPGNPHQTDLKVAHRTVEEALSTALEEPFLFPMDQIRAFEFARHLRNRLTHHRGLAGPNLGAEWKAAKGSPGSGGDGQKLWTRLAARPIALVKSREEMKLGAPELFATLAVSKRLTDSIEDVLYRAVEAEDLAELIVLDYQDQFPERFADRNKRSRRLAGFRNGAYHQATMIGPSELEAASARLFP